jgi:hypothetical protein
VGSSRQLERIVGVLARVRWENVALLAAVSLAFAVVLMGGELSGGGSSRLPADVGLAEEPRRGQGRNAPDDSAAGLGTREPDTGERGGRAAAGDDPPRPEPEPRGRPRRKGGERSAAGAVRGNGRAEVPPPPAPVASPPLQPPAVPPGAGGEFAPD